MAIPTSIPKTTRFRSRPLGTDVSLARWGHAGTPVLLFPTAGGDAEECERFLMIRALAPLLAAGRIRVWSCDSVSGRAWIDDGLGGAQRARIQNRFDAFVHEEVVPAIRAECGDPSAEIVAAGQSIGAFNALASLCRHPDEFRVAVCMSGTYDLTPWMDGAHTLDFHYSSPLHFLPLLDEGEHLARLRTRFAVLAVGEGPHESPAQSWRVAQVLGSRGVPNRVDDWGADYPHDWPTWRAMLPKYLAEIP